MRIRLLPKLFTSIIFLLITHYLLPTTIHSQQEFSSEYQVTYTANQNGDAQVNKEITLTNKLSEVYATSYTLVLEGDKPINIETTQGKTKLERTIEQSNNSTNITINFSDAVVGKGKSRIFNVNYTLPKFATQNGQVWEITIPRLASPETFDSYSVTLKTPKSFGEPAYISPKPKEESQDEQYNLFAYEKENVAQAGVVAAFGDSQIFSLDLKYHLENPYQTKKGKTEIALVPDTAFQKVYYTKLDPKPETISPDSDGNWLATYTIDSGKSITVEASLVAQIFGQPQEHYLPTTPYSKSYYLSQTQYWQTNNPKIANLAQKHTSAKEIYDFVVTNLKYDYSRVQENIKRLGASNALDNPQNAVCMEFTDLFIAIARAANIPAREINGYAYTENPEIQPLSLVADVLHAWPEYWDEKAKIWRPIDPTWGNTTGGIDYFSSFDLSHITFAIHGNQADYPFAAGSYKTDKSPQKDVTVQFGQLPQNRTSQPTIQISSPNFILPFVPAKFKILVANPGPVALYNQSISITNENIQILYAKSNIPTTLDFLAPYDKKEFDITTKTPLFLFNKSGKIEVKAGNSQEAAEIPYQKTQLISLIIPFGLLCLTALITFLSTKIYSVYHTNKKGKKSP